MDSANSQYWFSIYSGLDQSFMVVSSTYHEFEKYKANALTQEQTNQLQEVKILMDEFVKVLKHPNNNLNTGYVDIDALKSKTSTGRVQS